MTQPNWNPNGPGKKGIELLDVGYGHDTIDAASDVGELQWESTYTGQLEQFEVYSGGATSTLGSIFGGLGRPMVADLVPRGSEAWGALAYNDHSVTAVTGSSGMYNENLTTPVTTTRLNGNNDGLFVACSTLNAYLDLQFATGAYALTRHVLAVEILFWGNISLRVGRFDPTGQLWFKDYPFWNNKFVGGSARWGEALVQHGASAWSHWTPQMVRDFASGGTRKVRISCRAGAGAWALDRVLLRVFSIPERRRGVGLGVPTTGWVDFEMDTPPATGAPNITSGEELTMMVRRITDYNNDSVASAVLPWRYMRGRSPSGDWRRHQQTFNPNVSTSGNGQSLMPPPGDQLDGIPAVRMVDGGTVFADSMPYHLSRGAMCWGANTVSQYLTMAGGATIYGQAYVVAGWVPTAGRPVAPLRAELYDSGGTRVLDAVEVTAADVDRLPVTAPSNNVDDQTAVFKTVQLRFPNSETLSAAQYELRFSSPDSTEARPWRIAALIADAHTTDQTYGGSTDYGDGQVLLQTSPLQPPELVPLTDPGVRSSDILAQLVEVPPPVTGTGSSVGAITAHHLELCDPNAGCAGCADESMPYSTVTWSPAPSGSPDVVGYDLDRRDDLAPDWERVAYVDGRTTERWDDLEVRIGVRSEYRIRVVREDGVTGDWSDPVSVTVPTGQVALSFSSNAAAGMGCVYPEVWEGEVVRTFRFLEEGDVELRRIFGRDRQVAFRPLERRGDGWVRTLLLNALCTVAMPTMAVFHPLRDLAWAPIPYVCVRDGEGNRWYANLRVPEGAQRRGDAGSTVLWLAEIEVVEVSRTPAVHDTSVAQVERVPLL